MIRVLLLASKKTSLKTSFTIGYLDLIIKLYFYERYLRQQIIMFVSYT